MLWVASLQLEEQLKQKHAMKGLAGVSGLCEVAFIANCDTLAWRLLMQMSRWAGG
jgi:hypothetical protein